MLRSGSGNKREQKRRAQHVAFASSEDEDDHGEKDTKEDTKDQDENGDAEERLKFGMVKVGHVYEVHGGVQTAVPCAHGETEHAWREDAAEVLQGRVGWDAAGTVRLEARRSGLCVAHIAAQCTRCDAVRRVVVEAKVMAANKGTPSLRDGVRCVGTCRTRNHSNSDSESSESDSEDDS